MSGIPWRLGLPHNEPSSATASPITTSGRAISNQGVSPDVAPHVAAKPAGDTVATLDIMRALGVKIDADKRSDLA